MKSQISVVIIHLCIVFVCCNSAKIPLPYNHTNPSSRFDNPNFVRDRFRYVYSPDFFDMNNRHRKPFNSAWMDYCDSYHCNDYHKPACGLNRRNMKFKWFQSGCHIILNNACSNYRGSLKYDMIDPKHCAVYVMYLRAGCPEECEDDGEIVCVRESSSGRVGIFINKCALYRANCNGENIQEYEEIEMAVCRYYMSMSPYFANKYIVLK